MYFKDQLCLREYLVEDTDGRLLYKFPNGYELLLVSEHNSEKLYYIEVFVNGVLVDDNFSHSSSDLNINDLNNKIMSIYSQENFIECTYDELIEQNNDVMDKMSECYKMRTALEIKIKYFADKIEKRVAEAFINKYSLDSVDVMLFSDVGFKECLNVYVSDLNGYKPMDNHSWIKYGFLEKDDVIQEENFIMFDEIQQFCDYLSIQVGVPIIFEIGSFEEYQYYNDDDDDD